MENSKAKGILIFVLVVLLIVCIGFMAWQALKIAKIEEKLTGQQTNNNEVTNIYDEKEPSKNEEDKTPELSVSQATKIVEEYLNIKGSYIGSPIGMRLLTEMNVSVDYNSSNEDNYLKTNIKYVDFKNEMLKYMTQDIFNTFIYYKNIDGILYVFDGGGTGIRYSNVKLELNMKEKDTYEYNVKCLQAPPEQGKEVSYKITLEYVNDKYVVSNMENL